MATERGTSDKTEATRFSQCAHDQRRRLEAEDCDSIRCAQLISGGRRRIRPPYCLAHARPTMCCIPSYYSASQNPNAVKSKKKSAEAPFRSRLSLLETPSVNINFRAMREHFKFARYARYRRLAPLRSLPASSCLTPDIYIWKPPFPNPGSATGFRD